MAGECLFWFHATQDGLAAKGRCRFRATSSPCSMRCRTRCACSTSKALLHAGRVGYGGNEPAVEKLEREARDVAAEYSGG